MCRLPICTCYQCLTVGLTRPKSRMSPIIIVSRQLATVNLESGDKAAHIRECIDKLDRIVVLDHHKIAMNITNAATSRIHSYGRCLASELQWISRRGHRCPVVHDSARNGRSSLRCKSTTVRYSSNCGPPLSRHKLQDFVTVVMGIVGIAISSLQPHCSIVTTVVSVVYPLAQMSKYVAAFV